MSEKHSIVIEEYLLLLYQLRGAGERLKAVTLAQRLKSSAPTVHATPQRMQRDDLIQMDDNKEINLTKEGERLACDIAFRHNLAEYFLCNTMGIPWYEVHKHAHQLEHATTPTVVDKLAAFLNYPETCPHGTPMPVHSLPEDCSTLDHQVEEGMMVKIMMIIEELEDSEELLKILQTQQLISGQKHQIISRAYVMSSMTLQQEEQQAILPFHVADKIHVVQVED
jgi:DtxR family Mn-dependent transcriptional regulator